MMSFAQAREDVLLWRALDSRVHHDVGFWIDVGAFDPHIDSATKEFSRHGWRGINIEPLEASFKCLVEDQPNDIISRRSSATNRATRNSTKSSATSSARLKRGSGTVTPTAGSSGGS